MRGDRGEGGLASASVALLEQRIGEIQGMVSRGVARPTEAVEILRMVRAELYRLRQIIENGSTPGPDGPRAA